jgi:hypothetical protein
VEKKKEGRKRGDAHSSPALAELAVRFNGALVRPLSDQAENPRLALSARIISMLAGKADKWTTFLGFARKKAKDARLSFFFLLFSCANI